MDKAEQEAEEILVEQGFAEPEEMEPKMAELLRKMSEETRGKLFMDLLLYGNAYIELPSEEE